ncbi:MAG: hypothetical protein NC903_01460, partial [Candidatus Omnitrophica bacterium]|nr:hypothetical protein [Candidatus Omnitrophota bacterium]
KKNLLRSVSFTTRAKRKGEIDGRDYFFISEEEFKEKLKRKKILEWTRFLDYYYGTSLDYFKALLKKKKPILLCLDEKGALKIKRIFGKKRVVTIFVIPPKLKELAERIALRHQGLDEEEINRRLFLAKEQIKNAYLYDYQLINDNFKKALKELKGIILKEIEAKYGLCSFRETFR